MSSTIDEAIEYLKAGRFHDAEALLHPLVAEGDADAMHFLGLLRDREGDLDRAEALVRRAIAAEPKAANFHSSLGIVLAKRGDATGAVQAAARAVELAPQHADMHHNYALALSRNGKLDEAIDAYRHAVLLDPQLARAHASLGHALAQKGRETEALAELFRAIALDESCVDARLGVAVILSRRQEFDEAMAQLALALRADPRHVPSLVLLSLFQSTLGRGKEAEELALSALAIEPESADAHNALGDARAALGRIDAAQESYARAGDLKPHDTSSIISSVAVLWFEGKHSIASARLEASLERSPNDPLLLEALAYSLYVEGDPGRAIELARRAIALDPTRLSSRSLLLGLQYQDEATSREERFAWALDWNRLASQWNPRMPAPRVEPGPDRPLRIGYVSGCFKNHPVGYAIAPILARHDPRAVDVVLYANQEESDETTTQIRRTAKAWRPVARLSDPQLAQAIHEDRIDILVDLAGHSSGHRLEVFVRKPAPIQVTWNWTATTGVGAIDWVLCDDVAMPPDEERWFVERPWRLPGCHAPVPRLRLPTIVGPLPVDRKGTVTFGSFNNLYKVTDAVIALWARVLHRVPGSKLVMCTFALHSPKVRDRMRERFAKHGIRDDALILAPGSVRLEFLRGYNEIDICLDPFPHNGGMSTVEATFMGVPVVTRDGDTFCSRMGATIARTLGVPELVARDDDEYVAIAERLARDQDALSILRGSLRGRLDRAADPVAFARKLEEAYRGMWHAYLASH